MESGYERSNIDRCLFTKKDSSGKIIAYILVYVDDCLVMGVNDEEVNKVYQILVDKFVSITQKEGDLLSFIGLEIRNVGYNINVGQSGYLKKLMEEYDVKNTSEYPSDDHIFEQDNESSYCDKSKYLKLVMQLMYAAIRTRPDILYPCIVLACRSTEPTDRDYKRLLKILEYLNGSLDKGLVFRNEGGFNVNCYVDASFNSHEDARGHTGFIIYPDLFGSCGVLFKSCKQKTVADSSAEAELIALHEAVQHLIYVNSIYEELGIINTGSEVYNDNQATIKLSSIEGNSFKGRSKFINRKYFSVHEHVENGDIRLVYVGTDHNVSDFLTKALVGGKFKKFRVDIMGSMEDYKRGYGNNNGYNNK